MNLEDQSSASLESTSYDGALEVQIELLNNMLDVTNMVVEPLSSPHIFEVTPMQYIDFDFLPDCLGSIQNSLCSYR